MVPLTPFIGPKKELAYIQSLLAFTTHHPVTDHETKGRAHPQLEIYQLATTPALFATATNPNKPDNLKRFSTALLYDLTLLYTPPKQIDTAPMTATPDQPETNYC